MKFLSRALVALPFVFDLSSAAPISEGSHVDLIVVPVGPVSLAEFEADVPPAPAAATGTAAPATPADPAKPQAPAGGGSGVRVKEQDPAAIAPFALFVKRSETEYFQVPCSQNAIGSPVRTPVKDSEIVLYRRDGNQVNSFKEVAKLTIGQSGERILVVLTKPLNEKKWSDPKVSIFKLARTERPQLFFVNASQETRCGVNVAGQTMGLDPLKPLAWQCPPNAEAAGVDVALAMSSPDGGFLPMFYQSNVELKPHGTTLFIPYGVTAQESFRGGKFATGTFSDEDFRVASPYKIGK
jgi:hypothetical protein